jgi:hypothetical protein
MKRRRRTLKPPSSAPRAVPLEERVERVVTPPSGYDSEDQDPLSFVEAFMRQYADMPPLPPTSILTKEDAAHALVVLGEAQQQIDAQLKAARALKQMLLFRQTGGSGSSD